MNNTVLVTKDGPITTIKLNRPDQLNAMDVELLTELNDELIKIKEDDSKIVVLTGEGNAFSAGGDMKTMLQNSDPNGFKDVMGIIKNIVTTFYSMPKVTVSVLNGAAAGLGLSVALAADFIIAKEDAKVAMNFIGIGLIPDGGGHFFMEQRLGPVKAKHTIWEGKMMTANEAQTLGLVDLATPDWNQALNHYLNKLQQSPIQSMITSKLIINGKQLPLLEEVLDQETRGQAKMRQTHDHKEGIDAFLNKREPQFIGE
ncbi:enoyl-CoA hydratase [Piscibacillus halophilus]|uniref:Enoyl-CoA hydratase n=1 Tax=Piscibacillus halophilus TaxID=571933 RepID=A0A1H9K8G3_9BACI|nr:enoyl-CoA hydratase [Piscibacillus halophilus]SEQ95421.1 Enoyl-CoA hydratase [Piscibacillus halophilus]